MAIEKKRAYYNALDALWMMERHGMTFEERMAQLSPEGNVIATAGKIHNASCDFEKFYLFRDWIFYPDAVALALLAPRAGDSALYHGRSIDIVADEDRSCHPSVLDVTDAIDAGTSLKITARDGKPFIMPQWEDISA